MERVWNIIDRRAVHGLNATYLLSRGVYQVYDFVYKESTRTTLPELRSRVMLSLLMALLSLICNVRDNAVTTVLLVHHILSLLGLYLMGRPSQVEMIVYVTCHVILAAAFFLVRIRSTRIFQNKLPSSLKAPWTVDGDALILSYSTKSWQHAMTALTEYSKIAEELNHHPDVTIKNYKDVVVVVRTHKRDASEHGRILPKDVQLAERLEMVPLVLSKKWLIGTSTKPWWDENKKEE